MKAKIALVTGGTGGIGTAICRHLYKHGLKVVAGYSHGGDGSFAKQWQETQAKDDFKFDIVYGDVSDFNSCASMIDEIETKIGPVEVLVNNAGITRDATLRKMQPKDWEDVVRVNLNSLYNVTRQVINGMLERQYGRIILISSINGQKGQFGQTNYAATKSAMYGFTKSLALEVASKGITVNAVSPGYVATSMVEKMSSDVLEKIIADIPVKRLAEPDEVARLVAFLAAEESGYITGANFAINGGQYMD